MIVAFVCALALLCAQAPLFAQTDKVIPKEQAIAQVQKHLDSIDANLKAMETRFGAGPRETRDGTDCKKALSDALDNLKVGARVY